MPQNQQAAPSATVKPRSEAGKKKVTGSKKGTTRKEEVGTSVQKEAGRIKKKPAAG